MKKKIIIIAGIVIAIIIGVTWYMNSEMRMHHLFDKAINQRTYVYNFNESKEDFEKLLDIAKKYKDKLGTQKDQSFSADVTYEGGVLLNPNSDEIIKVTKEEQQVLKKIDSLFYENGGTFNMIIYKENKIIFRLENDSFAIIYSEDGSKPTGLYHNRDDEYNYYIKKLAPNWYSVTGTGKSEEELK